MFDSNIFICPACRSSLRRMIDSFSCGKCSIDYPIKNNVFYFSEDDFFYSVFSRTDAESIAELSELTTWQNAIDTYSSKVGEYTYKYITDLSRADWFIYLPSLYGKTILDIGSGWGNLALVLSKRCNSYICCDGNSYNLRLLSTRIRDNNIKNTSLFMYNANKELALPLENESIDLVILNGVLEWMGNIDSTISPKVLQIMALKEIRRVLKKGGLIYLGIENRYALGHLRGARPHGELPFIGLLPRFFSNVIMKFSVGRKHGTYIYSLNGYKRLFKKSGFEISQSIMPVPDYRFPSIMIPFKPRWVKNVWLDHFNTNRTWKFKILKKLFLKTVPMELFSNSYSIIAEKQ